MTIWHVWEVQSKYFYYSPVFPSYSFKQRICVFVLNRADCAHLPAPGVQPQRCQKGVKYHMAGLDVDWRLSLSHRTQVPRWIHKAPEGRNWTHTEKKIKERAVSLRSENIWRIVRINVFIGYIWVTTVLWHDYNHLYLQPLYLRDWYFAVLYVNSDGTQAYERIVTWTVLFSCRVSTAETP